MLQHSQDLNNNHNNLYINLPLNYNIAHTLNNLNIDNNIIPSIVELIKNEYQNKVYIKTKKGIILN